MTDTDHDGERDVWAIAQHLAKHGRGGFVSRAIWAHVERQRHPFKIIYDDSGDPYLLRVYQTEHKKHVLGEETEERKRPAVYLHYFFRGDSDRELHNHPWKWSVSWILTGGYFEERYDGPREAVHPSRIVRRELRPGSINVIRHSTYHRVHLRHGPAWSLFVAGPRFPAKRGEDWGFIDSQTGAYESWGARDERKLAEARARVSMGGQ